MAAPTAFPAASFADDPTFVAGLGSDQLLYVVCNVGDGDAQVVLLPADPTTGKRRAIVVDAAITKKVPSAFDALKQAGLLPESPAT